MLQSTQPAQFYVVSMRKFTLLFLLTAGLYGVYWFYRMFKTMQQVQQRELLPILRALFAFLFVLGLFSFIHREEQKSPNAKPWNPDFLGWVFAASCLVQLVFNLVNLGLGPVGLFVIFIITVFGQFYPVYQVQLAVNRMAQDPFGRVNAQLSTTNMLWILFGVFYLANAALNTYGLATGRLVDPSVEKPVEEVIPSPVI